MGKKGTKKKTGASGHNRSHSGSGNGAGKRKEESQKKQADALLERGLRLVEQDKVDQAKGLFEDALRLAPNHQYARFCLATNIAQDLYDRFELTNANFAERLLGFKDIISRFDDVIKVDASGTGRITGLAHHAKAYALHHSWILLLRQQWNLFFEQKLSGDNDLLASLEAAIQETTEHFDLAIDILRSFKDCNPEKKDILNGKAQHQRHVAFYMSQRYEVERRERDDPSEVFFKCAELWISASDTFCAAFEIDSDSHSQGEIALSHGECLQEFWEFMFAWPALIQLVVRPSTTSSRSSSSSSTRAQVSSLSTLNTILYESDRGGIDLEKMKSRTELCAAMIETLCAVVSEVGNPFDSALRVTGCNLRRQLLTLSVVEPSSFSNRIQVVTTFCGWVVDRTDSLRASIKRYVDKGFLPRTTMGSNATSSLPPDAKQPARNERVGYIGHDLISLTGLMLFIFENNFRSNELLPASFFNEAIVLLNNSTKHMSAATKYLKSYARSEWQMDSLDEAENADSETAVSQIGADSSDVKERYKIAVCACRRQAQLLARYFLCLSLQLSEILSQIESFNELETAANSFLVQEDALHLAIVCLELGDTVGCRKAVGYLQYADGDGRMELLSDGDLVSRLYQMKKSARAKLFIGVY